MLCNAAAEGGAGSAMAKDSRDKSGAYGTNSCGFTRSNRISLVIRVAGLIGGG